MIDKNKIFKMADKLSGDDKNIILSIVGSFIIRGGALIVSVISMPIYINFFDNSKVLGLWFTILSIMMWILSCDLGIGNGLRNNLVEAFVNQDTFKVKQFIVSAYVISMATALVIGVCGYWAIGNLNWNNFFDIPSTIISPEAIVFAIRAIYVGIILQFILKLITSILYALQKPAMPNLLSLISSILQVIIVLILPQFSLENNLKILSIIYSCCINIPLAVATVWVFLKELKLGIPKLKDCNWKFAINIMKLGANFFLVQILFMIIMNTNEIIITSFYGSEYVVDYQIYNKIFTITGSLFMIALTPLWSAITKAYNEKNKLWLKSIYKKLNYIVCIAFAAELGIALFIKPIVSLWIGDDTIQIQYHIAFIFSIFGGLYIYQSALSTIACGIGKLKEQAYCYTLAVIMKIVLVYYLYYNNTHWWLLIMINIVILLPYCLIQPRLLHHYIKAL